MDVSSLDEYYANSVTSILNPICIKMKQDDVSQYVLTPINNRSLLTDPRPSMRICHSYIDQPQIIFPHNQQQITQEKINNIPVEPYNTYNNEQQYTAGKNNICREMDDKNAWAKSNKMFFNHTKYDVATFISPAISNPILPYPY